MIFTLSYNGPWSVCSSLGLTLLLVYSAADTTAPPCFRIKALQRVFMKTNTALKDMQTEQLAAVLGVE